MDNFSFIVAMIGGATGVAALILQWRQQTHEAKARLVELELSRRAQEAQERAQEAQKVREEEAQQAHDEEVSAQQLARISELSVNLLSPLKEQIDGLTKRVQMMENREERYRRWIVELMLIVQHYSSQLKDVNLHDMVFTEIIADATITALIEAIQEPKAGEALGNPGLTPTGRLRVLKP